MIKINKAKASARNVPIFLAIFAFLVTTLLVMPANAATEATVTATVTVQNVSVNVSDGSVTYGTLAVGGSRGTHTGDLSDTQTAENDGNVTADLNIRGTNSANWTLAGSAGTNEYRHMFCLATCTTPVTNYTALTTSNQTLATSVATSGTQVFDLYITTPTSTTFYTQQSVNVTVQASAS